MPDRAEDHLPLSEVLLELSETADSHITIGRMMEVFGGRAMGGLLLIFALACTLPLPPGGTTIFGLPLVLLAPQLVLGARAPWLPARVRNGSVATADLKRGLPGVLRWLKRVESVSRPRLDFLFSPIGQRLIGLVCTLLALILILPIPLGNILPATAVTVLSLALVQRDGLLALLGYALSATSVAILVFAAGMISRLAHHLISVISGA